MKGYTLIEIIIVLAILSSINLIVLPNLSTTSSKREEIDLNNAMYETIDVINLCKCCSRCKKVNSQIKIVDNKLKYYENLELKDTYSLPESIRFTKGNVDTLSIDYNGNIKEKGTINLESKKGKKKIITIKVGTGYVSEQKPR